MYLVCQPENITQKCKFVIRDPRENEALAIMDYSCEYQTQMGFSLIDQFDWLNVQWMTMHPFRPTHVQMHLSFFINRIEIVLSIEKQKNFVLKFIQGNDCSQREGHKKINQHRLLNRNNCLYLSTTWHTKFRLYNLFLCILLHHCHLMREAYFFSYSISCYTSQKRKTTSDPWLWNVFGSLTSGLALLIHSNLSKMYSHQY